MTYLSSSGQVFLYVAGAERKVCSSHITWNGKLRDSVPQVAGVVVVEQNVRAQVLLSSLSGTG